MMDDDRVNFVLEQPGSVRYFLISIMSDEEYEEFIRIIRERENDAV